MLCLLRVCAYFLCARGEAGSEWVDGDPHDEDQRVDSDDKEDNQEQLLITDGLKDQTYKHRFLHLSLT